MKNNLPYSHFIVWLLMFCADVCVAQNDTIITRDLREIDVVAKKQHNSLTNTQLISQNEIKIAPAADIASLLRTFNGVTVKDYGGVGGLKTVSVRGLGASHTAVEYDGVPVSQIQTGQIDISQFESANISNLQLSVGQGDNLLKPAKFFAGGATLSINSSATKSIDSSELKLALKTGSFGFFNVNCNYATKISKHLIFNVLGDFMRSDGMYKFTFKNYKTEITEKRKNSDINAYKTEINLNYNDSSRQEFNFKFCAYYSKRGLPGSVIFYNNIANERLDDKNTFVQLCYKYRIFSGLTSKVITKYNFSNSYYTDENVKYQNGKLVQNSTQNEFYVSWINLFQIVDGLNFSLSQDYFYNTLNSDISYRNPLRHTYLAAANLRYYFRNFLIFNVGGVETIVREKTEIGDHFPNFEKFSPIFSVAFSGFKDFSLRFLYKNTFRVPTFNELYYTTLGSTNLKSENAREFNLGCEFSVFNTNFSIDFYKNFVDDKIVAIPTLYIWKMANYGKVEISGVDFSVRRQCNFKNFDVNFVSDFSYQNAIDVTNSNSKLYKSQIPYTPKFSGSFSSFFIYKKYSLGFNVFYCGKRYFLEYNIPDNEIDRYFDFSVSLSRDFCLGNVKMFAKISWLNFTNNQYEVIKYYPMPRQQFKFELNFLL